MNTTYLIPLANVPQSFVIVLAFVTYNITCYWNDSPDAGWAIDLYDANQVPLIMNIPLITGANLLEGMDYIGVDGQLYVFTDGDDTAIPTLTNLGVESNLYFVTVDS